MKKIILNKQLILHSFLAFQFNFLWSLSAQAGEPQDVHESPDDVEGDATAAESMVCPNIFIPAANVGADVEAALAGINIAQVEAPTNGSPVVTLNLGDTNVQPLRRSREPARTRSRLGSLLTYIGGAALIGAALYHGLNQDAQPTDSAASATPAAIAKSAKDSPKGGAALASAKKAENLTPVPIEPETTTPANNSDAKVRTDAKKGKSVDDSIKALALEESRNTQTTIEQANLLLAELTAAEDLAGTLNKLQTEIPESEVKKNDKPEVPAVTSTPSVSSIPTFNLPNSDAHAKDPALPMIINLATFDDPHDYIPSGKEIPTKPVVFSLEIGADGVTKTVSLDESCGDSDFDNALLEAAGSWMFESPGATGIKASKLQFVFTKVSE